MWNVENAIDTSPKTTANVASPPPASTCKLILLCYLRAEEQEEKHQNEERVGGQNEKPFEFVLERKTKKTESQYK